MSLSWDISEVEDYENKKGRRLDAMIFRLFDIGIPVITKDNLKQVVARVEAVEFVFGAMLHHRDENGKLIDILMDETFISEYIGLKTNVSRWTKAEFKKRFMQRIMDDHNGNLW
jgi:predicted PilT family ATPase